MGRITQKVGTMTTTETPVTLITGGRVYTADPAHPWAEAVVLEGERIAFVGGEAEARERARNAEQLHVPGGLVLPGLNESHVHMTGGSDALTTVNLDGIATATVLLERLRSYAAENPDLPYIQGYGVSYEWLDGLQTPERLALDTVVADRPVLLLALDFHSAWVNSEAIRRAGIERGAGVPLPNEVVVDASGLATGMLKERLAVDLVRRLFPVPTEQERDDRLCHAMQFLNSLGITSVQNMDGDLARLEQYARLRERGDLTVRAYHYMSVRDTTPREKLTEFAALTRQYADSWNRTRGIKLFIDGVVEAKTALMLEPYADGSDDTGVPDIELGLYREIVVEADRLGMDVATHAIGDRGVRLTLDAYEAAAAANGGRRDRRHRVEHIEVGNARDIPRFRALGVTASMQPFHAVPGGDPTGTPWTRLVGPAREPYSFPWRSLAESGADLCFGSDWPVVTPDVRIGLAAAVSRRNRDGLPAGGWQTQQCVTLSQALDAYTRGGAYAEARDHLKGRLRPGLLADVTIFAQDLFALRPHEIKQAKIAATIVGGRIVHRTI